MNPTSDSTDEKKREYPPIYSINQLNSDMEGTKQTKISGNVESAFTKEDKSISSWSPPTSDHPAVSSMSIKEKVAFLVGNISVEPMLFLFIFSMAMYLVTTQSLVIRKYCLLELNLSDAHCKNLTNDKDNEGKAEELASTLNMYKTLLETFPNIILSLFLGSWSDKHGRKTLLLLPQIGILCQLVLLIVYSIYETELEPRYLLVSSIPVLLSGGTMPIYLGCTAAVSDLSPPESRVLRIAVMTAFGMIGEPLGGIVGGVIFSHFGYVAVYVVAAGLNFICILYVIFVIKETVKKQDGLKNPCKDFFELSHVRQGLNTCFRKRENNSRMHLLILLLALTCNYFPVRGEAAILYLYTRKKFQWTEVMYSYYSSATLVAMMLGLLIVLPIFKLVIHLPDVALALIGAAARISKETLTAFAPEGWVLYAICPLITFTGMYGPILQGMMSHIVSREEQGKLYSVVGACEASLPLLGTVIYTKVYNTTSSSFPGSVFLMSGILFILPTIIFLWLRRDITRRQNAKVDRAITNDDAPT